MSCQWGEMIEITNTIPLMPFQLHISTICGVRVESETVYSLPYCLTPQYHSSNMTESLRVCREI